MFDCEVLSANICFLSNFPSFICSDSHLEFPQLYNIVHQIHKQMTIICGTFLNFFLVSGPEEAAGDSSQSTKHVMSVW